MTTVATVPERDPQTDAIVRAGGVIAFASGEVSTFDIGYTAGTILMDLQLLGTKGVIGMDDFVLDWVNSWSFQNPDIKAGYCYRTGMGTRKDGVLVPTPTSTPQEVAMVENFADLTAPENAPKRSAFAAATLQTQEYLDALWKAV